MASREASAREYAASLCRRFDAAERMPRDSDSERKAASAEREAARDAGWAFFVQYNGFVSPFAVLEAMDSELARNRAGVAAMMMLWVDLRYRSDFSRRRALRRRAIRLVMRLGGASPSLANPLKVALLRASSRTRARLPFHVSLSEKPGGSLFSYRWATVAKHLCWLDARLFTEVPIEDFRNKEQSENLKRFVVRSDAMSWWVVTNVLRQSGAENIARAVQFFLLIAHACFEHGDFFAAYSIVSSLQMWAVDRLRSMIKLDGDSTAMYKYLTGVFSPRANSKIYRAKLADRLRRGTFCVPHIGIYQRDLVLISDGNPDFNPDGTVNRDKIQLVVNALVPLWRFQKNCEDHPVRIPEPAEALLDKLQRLNHESEEVLAQLSLKLRPSKTSSSDITDPTATSEASSDDGSSSRSHTDAQKPNPLLPKLPRRDSDSGTAPPESTSPGATARESPDDGGSPAQSFIAPRQSDQGSDQFKGLREA